MKRLAIIIVLLSLITAAQAQVPPTTFEKVSDSLWLITEPKLGGRLTTNEASPVNLEQLTVELNNRVKTAGTCYFISGCLAIGAAGTSYLAINGKNEFPTAIPVLLGLASLGLYFAGSVNIMHDKVYLTPDGVILKLNKPNRSTNVQQKMKK